MSIWNAFKMGVGLYLGWHTAKGVSKTISQRLEDAELEQASEKIKDVYNEAKAKFTAEQVDKIIKEAEEKIKHDFCI